MTVAARLRGSRPAFRFAGLFLATVCIPFLVVPRPAAQKPIESQEVRALWVARTSLTTPASVEEMVRDAEAGHFNTLLVQVRGRGDAYFNDGIEPKAAVLASQRESFDPLDLVLRRAHARHLRVHAWINVSLVSSAVDLPASRAHIVYRHPEWLMVPRVLAREMALLAPGSQLYLERLTRWIRSQRSAVEGLYLSPIPKDAAEATVSVVADIVARYPVDGVHLDYLRYPNADFDYSREALLAFSEDVTGMLNEADRKRREQAIGNDLVAWTEAFPERWREFRRERLTALVTHVRDSVKARRPGAIFSAAVLPDPVEASASRLQDWDQWMRLRILDVACPMAYAPDAPTFASQMASARTAAGGRPLWAGIGAYRLSSTQTIANIKTARRLGSAGVILFSYDSLVNGRRGSAYLTDVGRAAFDR
jgi:uncharacterized lipoprotein YddW (UPF0748 family)